MGVESPAGSFAGVPQAPFHGCDNLSSLWPLSNAFPFSVFALCNSSDHVYEILAAGFIAVLGHLLRFFFTSFPALT